MAGTVRWNSVRMEKKLTEALEYAGSEHLLNDYQEAASRVAKETSQRISASGRGGSRNGEFANIQHRVFKSLSNRYNVLVGWLNPPDSGRERGTGGRLWYQYQDMGFHLFGGPNWIEGVGATIDQRYRLIEALEDVNRRHVDQLARILNR